MSLRTIDPQPTPTADATGLLQVSEQLRSWRPLNVRLYGAHRTFRVAKITLYLFRRMQFFSI